MKNIATGLVAVAALGLGVCNSALAADMPVRYVPPAPVATWTGFYASVDLGYARKSDSNAWNPLPVVCSIRHLPAKFQRAGQRR